MTLDQFQTAIENATTAIGAVIIGQEAAVRFSLIVVLCNQHALIEGVPGLGKTLLARTIAAVLGSSSSVIQFIALPQARRYHRNHGLQSPAQ